MFNIWGVLSWFGLIIVHDWMFKFALGYRNNSLMLIFSILELTQKCLTLHLSNFLYMVECRYSLFLKLYNKINKSPSKYVLRNLRTNILKSTKRTLKRMIYEWTLVHLYSSVKIEWWYLTLLGFSVTIKCEKIRITVIVK